MTSLYISVVTMDDLMFASYCEMQLVRILWDNVVPVISWTNQVVLFLSRCLHPWYLLSYRMKGKFEKSCDRKSLVLCSLILGRLKGRVIWPQSLVDILDDRLRYKSLNKKHFYVFWKILLKICITLEPGYRYLSFCVFNFMGPLPSFL